MVVVESFTTNDASNAFYGAGTLRGQTFTLGTTGVDGNYTLTTVEPLVALQGAGQTPGVVTVTIEECTGGYPNGSVVSSGSFDADTLTTTPEYKSVSMSSYTLQASTQYAVILEASNADVSNQLIWRFNNAGGYSGGKFVYDNDVGSWSELAAADFAFKVNGTEATGGRAYDSPYVL